MTVSILFESEATRQIAQWHTTIINTAVSPFTAAQQTAAQLGAHFDPHSGRTIFGFWIPELADGAVSADSIWLEILRPQQTIDLIAEQQTVTFDRYPFPLTRINDVAWTVLSGLRPGSRHATGDFYRLCYEDGNGRTHTILDPLAHAIPFGAFAPAELVDLATLQANRTDKSYFATLKTRPDPDGVPRIPGPTNILQLHINTATAAGTLAALTAQYQTIAAKIEQGEPLTPTEQNYIGYDAIQLMPIEPTIEHENAPGCWRQTSAANNQITVSLHRPTATNWGYDVVIAASPATNPRLLATRRPHELLDFITTLHTFPGKPIKVILDVVYGHADNQALGLLNDHFFAGANMYGQNLRYSHPMVRAILLEMQRRKSNYGVDGIRVDGAQDFKNWNPQSGIMEHDDDFLRLMNNVEQEVAGVRYRPWMIFEDGRPWPRDDWELASSYREVTKQFPNVVQWGPLTFAHNTPFLFTFWVSKWWRIDEMMKLGSHWITGCANHDTLRRGTQVDPTARVNSYLGSTLPTIFKKGYDNPAATLFTYAIAPGIPMEFINALMHAPWSFIRNTDDRFGVKVVSEEARFLDWAVDDTHFAAADAFTRLKEHGFTDLAVLDRFMKGLDHTVRLTDYDLDAMAQMLNALTPPLAAAPFTVASLKAIARDWMDDVHDYVNVSRWAAELDAEQVAYNLAVREFRRQRPYLRQNLTAADHFAHNQPTAGSVLFYGLRHAPNDSEQILFLANMEGAPITVTPADLPLPHLPTDGWQVALTTPELKGETTVTAPLTLHDSQGIVFTRKLTTS